MQFGLLISVLLHVAILGGALFSIQSRPELRVPETEPVAVGMISPGEVTKVRQGVRTAKLLEAMAKDSPNGALAKKQAPRPKKMAAAALPPPPPAAPEEKAEPAAPKAAAPDPAAEARKKLEAEQQERARQEAAKAEAQKRAEEAALKAAEVKAAAEKKRVEEAAQRAAEEKKRAEEAARKAAEEKRAEAQKRAEEERRRAEEKKRAEERRRQAELKKKKREEEAERRRKAAALKKKQDEARKQREAEAAKKKRFDTDKIAALLNKVPDQAPPPPSSPSKEPTKAKEPTLGAPEGRDQQLSASELAMIVQAIRTCVTANWTVLSGGASARDTVVRIRLRFNEDGTLSSPPEIVNRQNSAYFVAISESAVRAVEQCEPYDLPRAKYRVWKDMVMNFSPKDMY